jgi:putative ABC transport system permease protein
VTRLALFLIGRATPWIDRESVVGDTLERLDEVARARGKAAARRWLWRETGRVLYGAPAHWLAARRAHLQPAHSHKDAAMSSFWNELGYAIRRLARTPGFTLVAAGTLALGIGANTAMFAVVNAVLLKPLPFQDADRLMLVHITTPPRQGGPGNGGDIVWSYPKYQMFRELQQTFATSGLFSGRAATLAGDGDPERVQGEIITDEYLATLGINPMFGRGFTADEANRAGATPVVLLGHGLWTRRYGGDRSILGRHIQLGGVTHTVVGVLPRGFRGLSGEAEWWTPLAVTDSWALSEAQGHEYSMVALRKPEVPEAAAVAAVRVYGSQIDATHRDGAGPSWGASAASLYASRVDADVRRIALVVLSAVGFVLLIACVNLTSLLAARAVAREREVAIRVALGAPRGRIVRQFGIEGLALAGLGAVGGVVIALGLLSAASAVLPDADIFFRTSVAPGAQRIAGAAGLTRVGARMIGLDGLTLVFTAGVGLLTALLVSVLPAIQASILRPGQSMRLAPGSPSVAGRGRPIVRGGLVAVQIALALVLLTGSGLMLKSAMHLRQTSLGIDAGDVVTAGLELPSASYRPERGNGFYAELINRLQQQPGLEAVGLASCLPVSGGCNATSIKFPSEPRTGRSPSVGVRWASSGYFDALRIRLVQGRMFTDLDRTGRPKVVLVNEAAVRTFWPDGNALGQRIAVGQGGFQDGAEVIGVVADVRYRAIESAATPDVYLPTSQSYRGNMRLFVRSSLGTAAVVSAIERTVQDLDANLPLISVKTMDASIGDAMWRTRVAAWLLSAFAGLALLLTAIGVFGVMAQVVAQRTSEFGIRMALGARPRDVLSLVLGRAAVMTSIGLAIGLLGSYAATRVIGALLYQVTPTDPATFGIVALVIAGISLTACYVPARRATRVDAVVALRSE